MKGTKKTEKSGSGKKQRRAVPRAPARFKSLRESPSQAETAIRNRLEDTAQRLTAYSGRVLVHRYANDTVDGEISFAIPRGVGEDEFYRTIMDGFGQAPGHIGPGYWLSVGQRYTIKEGEEVYRRYKGMNELATYYAGMTRRGVVAMTFGAARDFMTPGAHEKYRRKASQAFVRLHWNPNRSKPER